MTGNAMTGSATTGDATTGLRWSHLFFLLSTWAVVSIVARCLLIRICSRLFCRLSR